MIGPQRRQYSSIPAGSVDGVRWVGVGAGDQRPSRSNIGRDMEALAQAIQIEDWSQVRRLSHRMKGAAANSGAQRMSVMAARMEDQAQSQAPGRIKELYPPLVETWQQTQTAMQDSLSEISV